MFIEETFMSNKHLSDFLLQFVRGSPLFSHKLLVQTESLILLFNVCVSLLRESKMASPPVPFPVSPAARH